MSQDKKQEHDVHRLMQLHPAVKKYHSKEVQTKQEDIKKVEAAYADALNHLAETENGRIFLKSLLAYCGVFSYNDEVHPTREVIDSTKRKVWLEMIRPYLKKENIKKVEV